VGALAAAGALAVYRPDLVPTDAVTLALAAGAALLGATAPDLDRMHGLAGKLVGPFCLGHRRLSHSLLGLGLFVLAVRTGAGWLAAAWPTRIDADAVAGAFALGMASHLLLDALTPLGVPILWPLPVKLALPVCRVTTGSLAERYLVLPALALAAAWFVWRLLGPSLLRTLESTLRVRPP